MSCRKASEYIEKSKVKKLSFTEKIAMNFHVSICKKCQQYKTMSNQLDDLIAANFNAKNNSESVKFSLSEAEKKNMIDAIAARL
jgi:hypothetical protein